MQTGVLIKNETKLYTYLAIWKALIFSVRIMLIYILRLLTDGCSAGNNFLLVCLSTLMLSLR